MKFLSKLSRRERLFLYVIVSLAVIFLMDKFIFSVMLQEIKKMDSEISIKRNQVWENLSDLSSKDKITKENSMYKEYFVKDELPELKLRELLNGLAVQSEFANINITPFALKEKDRYAMVLEAKGKMKYLVSFLYKLSTLPSPLKVEKMELTPEPPKSDTLRIHLRITKTVIQ